MTPDALVSELAVCGPTNSARASASGFPVFASVIVMTIKPVSLCADTGSVTLRLSNKANAKDNARRRGPCMRPVSHISLRACCGSYDAFALDDVTDFAMGGGVCDGGGDVVVAAGGAAACGCAAGGAVAGVAVAEAAGGAAGGGGGSLAASIAKVGSGGVRVALP